MKFLFLDFWRIPFKVEKEVPQMNIRVSLTDTEVMLLKNRALRERRSMPSLMTKILADAAMDEHRYLNEPEVAANEPEVASNASEVAPSSHDWVGTK